MSNLSSAQLSDPQLRQQLSEQRQSKVAFSPTGRMIFVNSDPIVCEENLPNDTLPFAYLLGDCACGTLESSCLCQKILGLGILSLTTDFALS
jgi:hypothetical protein